MEKAMKQAQMSTRNGWKIETGQIMDDLTTDGHMMDDSG